MAPRLVCRRLTLALRTFIKWLSAVLFPMFDIKHEGKFRYRKRVTTEVWIEAKAKKGRRRDATKTRIPRGKGRG